MTNLGKGCLVEEADKSEDAIEGFLFDEVTRLTGLPKEIIQTELADIVSEIGAKRESLTMEELRQAMSSYLQEVLLEKLPTQPNSAVS